jgi:hypothetical protein
VVEMKKFLILGILLTVVFATGCTFSNTQTSSDTQTYQGNGISFKYPTAWIIYTPSESTSLVNLKTSAGNSSTFSVYKESSSNSNLDYWKNINENVSPTSGDKILSEKTIKVDGVNAYQIIRSYQDYSGGEQELIFFIKNGEYYELYFTTDSVQSIQNDIDTIVNSFKVKNWYNIF